VERLFEALESRAIRYAVLRNYEQLPSLYRAGASHPHTDIDLVVDSRDMDDFRQVVTGIAEIEKWDALTECDHWAQSPIRHHNIHVFRFYRANPLDYLQIDVFHALLIWSLPLFDEQQLLSERTYDEARCLTRIDALRENIFRLFQIAGHCRETPSKTARYRDKVLAFRTEEPKRFEQGFRGILSGYALEAVAALERPDWDTFLHNILMVRVVFTARCVLRHPLRTFFYLLCRLHDQLLRFFLRQCGCRLRVFAPTELDRAVLRGVMNDLVKSSCLDCWREYAEPARLHWQDYRIMEQNAVLIEWTNASSAQVDLGGVSDQLSCTSKILNALIAQHLRLYSRPKTVAACLPQEVAR